MVDAKSAGPALLVIAAVSNAGSAKCALATIDIVATATHKALKNQRPGREALPPRKKAPRLRAGRAARVGGKGWTGVSEAALSESARLAWAGYSGLRTSMMRSMISSS